MSKNIVIAIIVLIVLVALVLVFTGGREETVTPDPAPVVDPIPAPENGQEPIDDPVETEPDPELVPEATE